MRLTEVTPNYIEWNHRAPELSAKWDRTIQTIGSAPVVLESAVDKLGGGGVELIKLIGQAGALDEFKEYVRALVPRLMDQSAIMGHEHAFAPTGEVDKANIAVLDAWLDLLANEEDIKEGVKLQAAESYTSIMADKQAMLLIVESFVAEKLAKLRGKIAARQQTLANSQKIVEEHASLNPVLQTKKPILDFELGQLQKEERSLLELEGFVFQFFGQLTEQVNETVLVAANQPTTATVLRAA